MMDSRTEEVNRALEARRRLMAKRIVFGRIILLVWTVAAILNLVLLYSNVRYRLPLSAATADLLMMLRFLHPDQGATVLFIPLAILIPVGMMGANFFWKKHDTIRLAMVLLVWADVVCMIAAWLWNPVILFGESGIRHMVAIGNILLHFFLVWHISRARRAVESLEVLPEREYEGDPFEEFKNRSNN